MDQEEKKIISNSTPGALYPKNDLEEKEIESYKIALDNALKDDRINNIAVTAPYGVGKSTVLESYFNIRKSSYPWYIKWYNARVRQINTLKKQYFMSPKIFNEIEDYEFINLPNFFDSLESNELQKKVVEQLLFKSNPKRYPFSKLKRIKDTSMSKDIITLLISLFVIVSSLYLYSKATNKQIFFINQLSSFNVFDILLTITISMPILLFLVWFIRKIRISFAKSTIVGKGTIGPLEISNSLEEDNSESNVFNIFAEELLYFFRKSKTKIIIFEDLDRFGKPEIFQELRELNTNINKRQPKVIFIYSLQDKVFEKIVENENFKHDKEKYDLGNIEANTLSDNRVRSKAKFFDFVIPIFPVTSLYNSSSTLEGELKKYDILSKEDNSILSKSFLRRIGFFLKDQRMIILIVSEFHTYLKILDSGNKKDIDSELLFSMIVYKNFYAEDFEKIGYGNSLLNKTFGNLTYIYTQLIDVKTKELQIEKNNLEERILSVEAHINYDISAILNGYYLKLKIKYNVSDQKFNNQYFEVNQKTYGVMEGLNFFSDILMLEGKTPIFNKNPGYGSRNQLSVKDALTIGGEIDDISYLIKDHLERKTISKLSSELKKDLEEVNKLIRDIANETYQLTTGLVIRELSEVYDSEDELGEALKEIKEDNFKRFLFFNSYLTQNFYSFISPVDFSENLKDSIFIEKVLSYNDMQDYSLVNVDNTLKELDYAGANYSFAYSSNLLSHLLNNEEYDFQKSLIIEKMIEKGDYVFWDNLLSYSNKNNLNIMKGLHLLANKSPSFFTSSFGEISSVNNRYAIENLLKNFDEIISKVGESVIGESITNLINDSNSFYSIVNTLSTLRDYNIVKQYRKYFKIKNLFSILEETRTNNSREIVEYIYKEGIYEFSYKNIDSFGILFNLENNFDIYTAKFKDIDMKLLDLNILFSHFGNMYNSGHSESYLGFEEFINFSLGEHDFYRKFDNEPPLEVNREKSQEKCLVYFSKISFIDENYESNKRIAEKLNLIGLINKGLVKEEIVLELVNLHRLNYSFELLEAISIKLPNLITDYLLSVYIVYPDIFSEYLEEIEQLITDKEILYIIKNLELPKDILELGALLSGNINVWTHEHQEDLNFFDNNMINKLLQIKDFSLIKLLFEITSGEKRAKILHSLLENFPKELPLTEFEKILGIEPYLSKWSQNPDGRMSHTNKGVAPEYIMDVLDEFGIIQYRNKKEDFSLRKKINDYFS